MKAVLSDAVAKILNAGRLPASLAIIYFLPAFANADEAADANRPAIPEILVSGSRILNMDIRRTEDDTQPYVIFDQQAIRDSGANTIDDFLRQRLTMNATVQSTGQQNSALGNASTVSLRGLGTEQTLVLVDGHRLASSRAGGTPNQADLNRIPLAAIERIEVLPTTASGIYGGSATGGVVNIVLRRDYSGVETQLTYGDTFQGDAATRMVDVTAGFSLEEGRTNILFSGSYYESSDLSARDRDFLERGRRSILANNPNFYLTSNNPPLGSTTNIRSSTGANLTLLNGTNLNSPITHIPKGYAGSTTDAGAALFNNAGRYNFELADTAQLNGGGKAGLLNEPTVKSIMLSVRRQFTDSIDAFIDLSTSTNSSQFATNRLATSFAIPAGAPGNPFAQGIRVTTPAFGADTTADTWARNRRALAGVIFRLGDSWHAEADYTFDTTTSYSSTPGAITTAASTAVSTGQINVLRDTTLFPVSFAGFVAPSSRNLPSDTVLKDAAVRVAGSLWSLPGGDINLTTLVERRDETLDRQTTVTGTQIAVVPSRSQVVNSLYVEMRAPLFSSRNQRTGLQELELQLAGRYDDYSTEGAQLRTTGVVRAENTITSTDPTFGVRYKPIQDLMLRASYGTGFLPPGVNQLVADAPSQLTGDLVGGLRDPRRGGESVGSFTLTSGGNADLEPEESESWSAGVVVTPQQIAGLRLSVDWTKIDKTNNITPLAPAFGSLQSVIDNETLIPNRITRGPASGGFQVGPIVALNTTSINLSRTEIETYDAAIEYQTDIGAFGNFGVFARATYVDRYLTQTTSVAPTLETAGTVSALRWKANTGLTWSRDSWTASWSTRYLDSYWVNSLHTFSANQGSARVDSQIYHDAQVGWNSGVTAAGSLLSNIEVQLSVRNVFDKEPPFDANTTFVASNLYSPLGDPRQASYLLSIRKAF